MEEIIVPIGICVVLPLVIVWLAIRSEMNKTNKRTEIVMAAIEKNSEIDVEEFLKKLNPPKKSLKEKLMGKLLNGCICLAIGLGCLGYQLWVDFMTHFEHFDRKNIIYLGGIILTFIGIAFLIVFFVSKRMMAQELKEEDEQRQ